MYPASLKRDEFLDENFQTFLEFGTRSKTRMAGTSTTMIYRVLKVEVLRKFWRSKVNRKQCPRAASL